MKDPNEEYTESSDAPSLTKMLLRLQLPFLREHYHELAQTAAEQHLSHLDYLQRLIEGEVNRREDSGLQRRIRLARFPVLKTLAYRPQLPLHHGFESAQSRRFWRRR
jgi:DNA replication protein DnaC